MAAVLLIGCGGESIVENGDGATTDAASQLRTDAAQPADLGRATSNGDMQDVSTPSDGGTSSTYDPPYPRLGAYPIGGPQTYDATFRSLAAKFHVVIVSNWQGYSTTDAPNMAAVFKDIKARSTIGTKLFSYINDNETASYTEKPALTEVASEHWYLYSSDTSGTPVPSAYSGATEVNHTTFVKPDSNGKIWSEWLADFRYAAFVQGDSLDAPNPYGDGFFMDNVFWSPRVDGDWNLDGKTDSSSDPTVQGWYRAGYQHYFEYVRSIWPNSLQLGNVADWGEASATLGVYAQMADGGVLEGYLGDSWSIESWGGFAEMMASYKKTMDALRGPKLGIIGDDQAVADYQGMRYGLGATLMDDAYYYHSNGGDYSVQLAWYDEYNSDLGHPSLTAQGARQTSAWSQGVWRRDFTNGIVLVNPKGNGSKTVVLGGTFKKLSGSQDHAVNDGTTVTSVTLQDRDGIILLR